MAVKARQRPLGLDEDVVTAVRYLVVKALTDPGLVEALREYDSFELRPSDYRDRGGDAGALRSTYKRLRRMLAFTGTDAGTVIGVVAGLKIRPIVVRNTCVLCNTRVARPDVHVSTWHEDLVEHYTDMAIEELLS